MLARRVLDRQVESLGNATRHDLRRQVGVVDFEVQVRIRKVAVAVQPVSPIGIQQKGSRARDVTLRAFLSQSERCFVAKQAHFLSGRELNETHGCALLDERCHGGVDESPVLFVVEGPHESEDQAPFGTG